MKTFLHLDTVGSTQDFAKKHFHEFNLEKLCYVFAEHQTNGHGTRGRTWESPKGKNLLVTFFSKCKNSPSSYMNLAQVSSLSILHLLKTIGVKADLKWPNDVYIRGKKCAGSLCELTSSPDCFFIGIGLNVNMKEDEIQNVTIPFTSLHTETNKQFDIETLLTQLSFQLEKDLALYEQQGFAPFLKSYKENMPYFGCNVIVENEVIGKSLDIETNGAMIIQDKDLHLKKVFSGSLDIQSKSL